MQFRSILLSAASVSALAATPAYADSQAGSVVGPEIVVSATPLGFDVDEHATPVVTLSGDELTYRSQATLGETLAGMPGINFDNFGGGAGRPVIRGQTAPRVQALADGSSIQDASAISPDHAVTTEPLLLRGIEVLRGPAALLYGGGAIGGAINLLDDKVPTTMPEGGISAVAEGRYGTGDHERSAVGGVTVGLGSAFALRLEGVRRKSDDYGVPESFGARRVVGSFNDTSTVTVGGSWIGANGYLGLAYTRQRSEYGLPGHEHQLDCHPHDDTLHCEDHEHEDEDHDHADHADEAQPYIKLKSDRFDLRGEYRAPLPGIEKVRLRASMTDYQHSEIEDGVVGTIFANKGHDIRFEVTHDPIGALRGVFGVQHSYSNFETLGEEAFLPHYRARNTALFLLESLQAGPVRFELAARQEWQRIATVDGREASHSPFSVSGAVVWDIGGDYSLALALARSQRAPNAQELYADGAHLATNTFELGSPSLGKETSRSADLTFRKKAGATTFTIGAYHQDFKNYIFANTLDRFEDLRLIRYTAADATFTGIDGEIRHEFSPHFALSAFGDYVRAKFKDGLGDLPRIPAGRLGVRMESTVGAFHGDIEYYHVFEQDRIAAYETKTPGYDMVNATLAYKLDPGVVKNAEIFIRGVNLTNELAFNHASFIKDVSPMRGRSVTFGVRVGI